MGDVAAKFVYGILLPISTSFLRPDANSDARNVGKTSWARLCANSTYHHDELCLNSNLQFTTPLHLNRRIVES